MIMLLVIILLVVAIPISLVVMPWHSLARRRRQRRFLEENAGKVFLIWHSRRGWHDFCVNNLLPALPPEIQCVHDRAPHPPDRLKLLRCLREAASSPPSRPYLIFVGAAELHGVALHELLLPWKTRARRSRRVRREVGRIVAHALREGRGWADLLESLEKLATR
jgi:hypothetical protein